MQGVLRRVVHIISVPRARFLGLHVVRDDDVFPREGRPSTIHLADPVVAPPVLEGRGEERVEDLDVRFVHKGVRQNALVRRVQGTGHAEVRREFRVLERFHVRRQPARKSTSYAEIFVNIHAIERTQLASMLISTPSSTSPSRPK